MVTTKATKKGPVKATFELSHLSDADKVDVVGEWNGWQPQEMQQFKNGKCKLTVDLEPGNSYQFRYLVDGSRWENDPEAEQVPNEFGEGNSVIRC